MGWQQRDRGAGDAAEIAAGAVVLMLLAVMRRRHLLLHGAAAVAGDGMSHRLRVCHLGDRRKEHRHRRESGEAASEQWWEA